MKPRLSSQLLFATGVLFAAAGLVMAFTSGDGASGIAGKGFAFVLVMFGLALILSGAFYPRIRAHFRPPRGDVWVDAPAQKPRKKSKS